MPLAGDYEDGFVRPALGNRTRRHEGEIPSGSIGGIVASESALSSAGTLLSWVRAPPPAPRPESLKSPCCELAVYKNKQTNKKKPCLFA
ncbi:hypothetical protein PoB_000802100 [Plakobranchus ocellatus]|uniref:Uncharacterized protein n=1 Tax=Plakobranchus ocellatus TaxID=259542 RepID=A0AAV3Y2U8_9GAST|nr:hypothetical protein PoB_000802100 [Plakobranchus ocellatus]